MLIHVVLEPNRTILYAGEVGVSTAESDIKPRSSDFHLLHVSRDGC